jgi:hypothetical protein
MCRSNFFNVSKLKVLDFSGSKNDIYLGRREYVNNTPVIIGVWYLVSFKF